MSSTIILPTDHVMQEFHTYSMRMQFLDFDTYECVRVIIDALDFAGNYPASFETDVSSSHEGRMIAVMSLEDIGTMNGMMRLLYERVYCAFCSAGLYDASGRLTHPYFNLHHGDIIVSTHSIDNHPTT